MRKANRDWLRMLKIVSLIFILICMFFITVMAFDCHRFVVREFTFKSGKVKHNHRYVFISDLHSKSFGKDNSKLIESINSISPEGILIAGDMFTAVKGDDLSVAKNVLLKLAEKYPIYYANGNHETKTVLREDEFGDRFDRYRKELTKAGVHFVNNEHILFEEDNICIYGLDLPFEYYKKSLRKDLSGTEVSKYLGEIDSKIMNILLAHDPEYFKGYSEWKADLVLSGHFHGGLVRIPYIGGVISPRYQLFPKYSYGTYRRGDSTMYLSCGLGTHTLPARLFNPGELTVIDIISEEQ